MNFLHVQYALFIHRDVLLLHHGDLQYHLLCSDGTGSTMAVVSSICSTLVVACNFSSALGSPAPPAPPWSLLASPWLPELVMVSTALVYRLIPPHRPGPPSLPCSSSSNTLLDFLCQIQERLESRFSIPKHYLWIIKSSQRVTTPYIGNRFYIFACLH